MQRWTNLLGRKLISSVAKMIEDGYVRSGSNGYTRMGRVK